MTHQPAQLRAGALGERLGGGVFVGRAVQADLHELVIGESAANRAQHADSDARLAHHHERAQLMGETSQETALEALKRHGCGEPKRAGALALAVLACCVLFASACATTQAPTAAPAAEAAHVSLPQLQFEPAETVEPAAVIDAVPIPTPSLELARRVLAARARGLSGHEREAIARALVTAEQEHGFPILSLLALIEQESRFDKSARGVSGSLGLMQLQPATARLVAKQHGIPWQSDATLFDAVRNVHLGLAYLADLREMLGTNELAMAAYNVGPGRVKQLLSRGQRPYGPYLKGIATRTDALRSTFGAPETAFGG